MVSGVCNTDNFSLLSITIDYGPFGFMEAYNPGMCDLYVNMYICIHTHIISLSYITIVIVITVMG